MHNWFHQILLSTHDMPGMFQTVPVFLFLIVALATSPLGTYCPKAGIIAGTINC